jgi:SAM-dependent methyltransferase
MSENEHYYSEHPTSAIKEREFTQKIENAELNLSSVSGVFAFEDRVDRASLLLIEAFEPSGASVLDLGCGYGAVGLFIKAIFGKQSVTLSDINERAVDYARKNALKNHLEVESVKSDLYSAFEGDRFDESAASHRKEAAYTAYRRSLRPFEPEWSALAGSLPQQGRRDSEGDHARQVRQRGGRGEERRHKGV